MNAVPPIQKVVCALIVRNNTVLLAKRKYGGDASEKWEFPGGKIRPFETEEEALVREIREELKMNIVVGRPLTHAYGNHSSFTIQLIPFMCMSDDEPTLTEHTAFAWVTAADILKYNLSQADVSVAKQVQELLK